MKVKYESNKRRRRVSERSREEMEMMVKIVRRIVTEKARKNMKTLG